MSINIISRFDGDFLLNGFMEITISEDVGFIKREKNILTIHYNAG